MEQEPSIAKKADEFLQIFKKGEEFTKDLIKENEKLRFRIAQLEENIEKSGNEEKDRLYEDRIKMLEEELNSLLERYRKVEEDGNSCQQPAISGQPENSPG